MADEQTVKKYYPQLTKESKESQLDDEFKKGIEIPRSLLKVIRLKCLDCCCGSANEVKECTCKNTCFLFPYRFGKNPYKKRVLTDEQKVALVERLKNARDKIGGTNEENN